MPRATAKDHYQVKFESKGRTYFGIVESFSDDAKEAAKQGKCIVNDAVLPKAYLVAEDKLVDIQMGEFRNLPNGGMGFDDEYHQYVEAERVKAEEINSKLPDGIHVGSLFSIGVGDGYASYVVTKINPRTVEVEWRGFCLDRWHDHYFGTGGTFPKNKIAQYVHRDRAMARLFKQKV